jgi:hypothetical protein
MTSTHPRQFAVVASQRTGSTLLIKSLDTSPQILCAGELFRAGPGIHHPEYQFPYRLLGSRKLARIIYARLYSGGIERHLRGFYAHAPAGVQAVGFKLMVSHAKAFPTIMPCLSSMGTTFLYLIRKDTFATALSYYKAKHSRVFHSDRLPQGSGSTNLVADESEFEELLRTRERDCEEIVEMHATFGGHLMTYEDMSADWDGFVARVGAWIGIPSLRVERSLSKLGESGGGIRIVNEDVLRDRFYGRSVSP